MNDLLTAQAITKHFDGVAALKGASLAVRPGEVHALMGENGAGKSTLSRILAGSVRPDSGSIRIDGKEQIIASPMNAQRLGIGMIYQELDQFPHLTVGENIVIGNLNFREHAVVSRSSIAAFCRPVLDQVGLRCPVDALVAGLSMAERQLLAIARALSMDTRLLLMDEPTSSLFGDSAERLFQLIGKLKQRGVSIVYVSHKMDEIFRVSDRVTVMRDGETIQTLTTAETNVGEIIRLMVGRDLTPSNRAGSRASTEVVLAAERLTTAKLRDVSFTLHRGEVLGLAGLVGSGRTELGSVLFGLDKILGGTVTYRGAPLQTASPRDSIRQGIGLLPEERGRLGLMMQMSVAENVTMASLDRLQRWGFVRRKDEGEAIEQMRGRVALHARSLRPPVRTLSGGNQQKALLARWLLVNPDVLFLDDPTRGIDVGAKQDIYAIIDELAAGGMAIILVSSELPELLRCSDRIAVLNNGRLAATFRADEATQEGIMRAATALPAEASC